MPNYTYSDDPHSAIKNKLGARTHDQLDRLEGAYIAAREAEIMDDRPISGRFDAAGHLKAIHRHLFQDIFEWAGHTRDEKVTLSDGTMATEPLLRKIDGNLFMVAPMIPKTLAAIGEKLRAAAYLKALPRGEFAERAADMMIDINAIHPFRDGNGRTQRVFIRQLAEQAGHELDFSVVSRARMIQASVAANDHGDNSLMRRLFIEISNPARVAALLPAIEFFEAQGFPWNDHYLSTAEPGQSVEVTFAGPAGQHFMARTGSGILIGKVSDLPVPWPQRGQVFVLNPSTWG
jgi:cell filamentation protein